MREGRKLSVIVFEIWKKFIVNFSSPKAEKILILSKKYSVPIRDFYTVVSLYHPIETFLGFLPACFH